MDFKNQHLSRRDFIKIALAGGTVMMAIPLMKPFAALGKLSSDSNSNSGKETTDMNPNSAVYPVGSSPLGVSMRDWIIKYSQWVFSFEDKRSPIIVEDGKKLVSEQPEFGRDLKNMFFLAGGYMESDTEADHAKRTIAVSRHSSLMITVVTGTWGYTDGKIIGIKFRDDAHIKQMTHLEMDNPTTLEASLDGRQIPYYKIDSGELHNMYNAKSKHYKISIGEFTRSYTVGYWVFLKPLSVGTHTIHTKGVIPKALDTGKPYTSEATYTIHAV